MSEGVSSATLAEWFKFTRDTIVGWCASGWLEGYAYYGDLYHSPADVTALLARVTRGDHKELTYDSLASGDVKILTTQEAAALLGIQPANLTHKAARGDVEALRFMNEWRFTDTTVLAHRDRLGGISRAGMTHILGGSRRTLRQLVSSRLLQPLSQKKGTSQYFTEISVRMLVRSLLPSWAKSDAGFWMSELQSSSQPAMTTAEVIEQLGIKDDAQRGLDDLIRNRQIFYLTLPGGNRRFSPVSVHDLFMQQKPLTSQELAWIFGGDPTAAQEWTDQHRWGCLLHDHTSGLEYRHACVINILSTRLSPNLWVGKWLEARKRPTSTRLIDAKTIAQEYDVRVEDITFAAREGFFGGVQQPNEEWAFPAVRLKIISRTSLLHWLATHKKTP